MKTRLPIFLLMFSPFLAAQTSLHVYHIGNSLTASLTLDRVHGLFEQAGIDYQFGSQLSGGKSLIRHMNYEEEPNQKWLSWETNVQKDASWEPDDNFYMKRYPVRFGLYEEALAKHPWDKLVMQIYGSSLHDDVKAIETFTGICLKNRTCNQFYIYSTWPNRPKQKDADGKTKVQDLRYDKAWQLPYDFDVTDSSKEASWNTPSRAYTDKLYEEMRQRLPENAGLYLIPAGEVLFQLDQKIKDGEIPGLAALAERDPDRVPGWKDGADLSRGINLLYADPIHLNPIPHKAGTLGIFVSGTTLFTVLSGKNPVGMSAGVYGLDDKQDAELIRAVQQVIWETVTSEPRSGVK